MKPALSVERLFAQVEQVWSEARKAGALPMRADISATKLKSALPYVSLIDVVAGESIDFRYRLLGQRIIEGFGRNITGGMHSQHSDRTSPIAPFNKAYRQCMATQLPQDVDHEFRNSKGIKVRMRARVWPLSEDGAAVTGLLGAGMFLSPSFD